MEKKKDLQALTALKGLFICIIVLHNSMSVEAVLEDIPGMSFIRLYGGSLGNSMFFILSGFLMSYGYRDRIRTGQITFGTYLARRLWKLYPMYALSNLASLLIAVWQYGISAVNLKRIALTFLMQGGCLDPELPYNTPTWFAAAILICYMVYYAGTSVLKSPAGYRVFLGAGIVWGYYCFHAQLSVPYCVIGNGLAYWAFFTGCALAEVFPLLERFGQRLKLPVLVLLATFLYLMLAYGVEVISGEVDVAFVFLICPMILYLCWAEGWIPRILRSRPFCALGGLSLGLFYWHLPVYFLMAGLLGSVSRARYPLYLLVLLAVSILTRRGMKKRI